MKFVGAANKIELYVDKVKFEFRWLSIHEFDTFIDVISNDRYSILKVLNILTIFQI